MLYLLLVKMRITKQNRNHILYVKRLESYDTERGTCPPSVPITTALVVVESDLDPESQTGGGLGEFRFPRNQAPRLLLPHIQATTHSQPLEAQLPAWFG